MEKSVFIKPVRKKKKKAVIATEKPSKKTFVVKEQGDNIDIKELRKKYGENWLNEYENIAKRSKPNYKEENEDAEEPQGSDEDEEVSLKLDEKDNIEDATEEKSGEILNQDDSDPEAPENTPIDILNAPTGIYTYFTYFRLNKLCHNFYELKQGLDE